MTTVEIYGNFLDSEHLRVLKNLCVSLNLPSAAKAILQIKHCFSTAKAVPLYLAF